MHRSVFVFAVTCGLGFVSLCVDNVLIGICGLLGRMFGSAGRSVSLSLCRWVIVRIKEFNKIEASMTLLVEVVSVEDNSLLICFIDFFKPTESQH